MNKKLVAVAAMMTALAFAGEVLAFGAIAIDDEQGETDPGYGFVTGEDTKEEARAAALKACRSQGNTNCKVVVWFETCGAYAASKKYYGYGFGKTKAVAVKKAVEMCGNKNCKPVISECE